MKGTVCTVCYRVSGAVRFFRDNSHLMWYMENLNLVLATVSTLLSRASSPIVATSSECGDEPEEATASSSL